MSGLHDIWNDEQGNLPEGMLQAYLEGKLTAAQQHRVEQWLMRENMGSDAMEGLQELSPQEAQQAAQHINRQLQHSLKVRKTRRGRTIDDRWLWLAIPIVLLVCLVGYALFHMMVKR